MRRVMFLILALATLLPTMAQAYEILVLQSSRDAGYETVLKGFHSGANPSERIIVLSDYAELDIVRIVREDRPTVSAVAKAHVSRAQLGDARRPTTKNVEEPRRVTVLGAERLVGKGGRLFETKHAGRCLVEGKILQLGRVRCVVGSDGVEVTTAQRLAQRRDVRGSAQRWVDLENRVERGAQQFVEGEVVRRDLTGDVQTLGARRGDQCY